MRADSDIPLKKLRVDGGVTNSDHAMQIQADLGGFIVERPEMRECVPPSCLLARPALALLTPGDPSCLLARSTALGAALLAGSALKLFGWDLTEPDTLRKVNARAMTTFKPVLDEPSREKKWKGWKRAVDRSRKWREEEDEDALEEELEAKEGLSPSVSHKQ